MRETIEKLLAVHRDSAQTRRQVKELLRKVDPRMWLNEVIHPADFDVEFYYSVGRMFIVDDENTVLDDTFDASLCLIDEFFDHQNYLVGAIESLLELSALVGDSFGAGPEDEAFASAQADTIMYIHCAELLGYDVSGWPRPWDVDARTINRWVKGQAKRKRR